jgi:hypothetical protein
MKNGIDRCAYPEEKQCKCSADSDTFGRFQQWNQDDHWNEQWKPNDRPTTQEV